jgi:hypothetical protein
LGDPTCGNPLVGTLLCGAPGDTTWGTKFGEPPLVYPPCVTPLVGHPLGDQTCKTPFVGQLLGTLFVRPPL